MSHKPTDVCTEGGEGFRGQLRDSLRGAYVDVELKRRLAFRKLQVNGRDVVNVCVCEEKTKTINNSYKSKHMMKT